RDGAGGSARRHREESAGPANVRDARPPEPLRAHVPHERDEDPGRPREEDRRVRGDARTRGDDHSAEDTEGPTAQEADQASPQLVLKQARKNRETPEFT